MASDARLAEGRNAAIVELARRLADQIDAAGPEASAKLAASYLSALKDLRRAIAEPKPSAGRPRLAVLAGDSRPGEALRRRGRTSLAELRARAAEAPR